MKNKKDIKTIKYYLPEMSKLLDYIYKFKKINFDISNNSLLLGDDDLLNPFLQIFSTIDGSNKKYYVYNMLTQKNSNQLSIEEVFEELKKFYDI